MNQTNAARTRSQSTIVPPQTMPEMSGKEVIDTRFGKVEIYRQNPIVFPNGLLGMPDKFEFCLTNFPSDKLKRFKLLQSLDDLDLSFITLPVELANPIVEKADIENACRDLELPIGELTLLFIVTVHRQPNGVQLSVNARAPIFVHSMRRIATQYVFHNNKYQIQHVISM